MPELKDTRFGTLEYAAADVLSFSEGLIGFCQYHRFIVVGTPHNGSFRWLQSLDEPSLAFLVVDPSEFVEGYSIELSDREASALEISEDTETMLFTTASIPRNRPQDMTINLAGPIVVNAVARTGRQLIVDHKAFAVKHRVVAEPAKAA